MMQQQYCVIGVMSGTSLDGIDLALVNLIYEQQKWNFKILIAYTYPYSQEWINKLKNAHQLNNKQLNQLNEEYTFYLAEQINKFINLNKINSIDAICSHGHTVLHQPQKGITIQIGNLPILSQLLKQTVVCDFRVQDVELGGQGAPLVPIGDKLLFSDFQYRINLGGFSNISYEINNKTLAYDICPVNTILNRLAYPKEFDKDGDLASQGTINELLLSQLNNLEFYKLKPPKSLGIEWVYENILPLLESFSISQEDKLRTFCEHISIQIAKNIQEQNSNILLTGGGVNNQFLINCLKQQKINITIIDQQTSDFKEALIFALLGVLRLRNEINVLSSVTGAKYDHCSGKIYYFVE